LQNGKILTGTRKTKPERRSGPFRFESITGVDGCEKWGCTRYSDTRYSDTCACCAF